MKFVTLALALLLAVGSQAVPLQADAPPMLAHVRSAATMYLNNLKSSLLNAVNQMEDADMKTKAIQHVNNAFEKIESARGSLVPFTDTVVGTVMDVTSDFRTTIVNDVEELKKTIEPMRETLKGVVEKHIKEYQAKIDPLMAEYRARHQQEMEDLRAKWEPVFEELQGKIATNVEETKGALMPIVGAVEEKVKKWMGHAKEMALPYVNEYKEQLEQGIASIQAITPEKAANLREELAPLFQDVVAKFQMMAEKITAAFSQQ